MKNLIEGTETYLQLSKKPTGVFELPPNHQPALKVPKGGSSCSNCKFGYEKNGESHCSNQYYFKWAGNSKLPFPADEFCSDWWEEK